MAEPQTTAFSQSDFPTEISEYVLQITSECTLRFLLFLIKEDHLTNCGLRSQWHGAHAVALWDHSQY